MIAKRIKDAVELEIQDYVSSQLEGLVKSHGKYVIKFVSSQWAMKYVTPQKLKVSAKPALTWGTATYVTPLAFPLSSALYGRVGLVCEYDPTRWKIFDATKPAAQIAYINWARAQPAYQELLLTVHSTHANHLMRDKFRRDFKIDCVLFHPDQEAEKHTDASKHVWMAVTDWINRVQGGEIDVTFSDRFNKAQFTVLVDEDFQLQDDGGLPMRMALRQIENATEILYKRAVVNPHGVTTARGNPVLPNDIVKAYASGGYVHVFIEP
jgi:hypothetical protein